jgi:hypothetical protein
MPSPTADLLDPELDADRLREDPEVDELLVGAIDLHTHPYPSPFPRRMSILDAARDADQAGFRAIVAKSHHHNTQMEVLALQQAGLKDLNVTVYGGVALNSFSGGLNPYIVEMCFAMGGKIVWFPTISSRAHIEFHSHPEHQSGFPTSAIKIRDAAELSIFGDDGQLKAEVHDILDVIASAGAILNCGHLPADDIDKLIPAARAAGVDRILVSHPSFVIGGTDRVGTWAAQGAVIEHCLALVRREVSEESGVAGFVKFVNECGVEHSTFSSDLGQQGNPLPITAYRFVARRLLDGGVPYDDVKHMVGGGNAARLLD